MRKFISPRWKGTERHRVVSKERVGEKRERERNARAERRIDMFANVRRVAATLWWKKKIAYFNVQHFPRRATRPPPGNLNCGLHADEIFPVRVRWPRLYLSALLAGETLFEFRENARRNVMSRNTFCAPTVSLPLSLHLFYFIFFYFFFLRDGSQPNLWQISGLPGNFNPREICLVKIFARNINANFASRVIPHRKTNKRHRFRNRMLRCNDHFQRFYVPIDSRIGIQFCAPASISRQFSRFFLFLFFLLSKKLNSWQNSFQSSAPGFVSILIYRCWAC